MNEHPLELWAFLENSDFQCLRSGQLYRYDEVRLTRHDELLEDDYRLLTSVGCVGVRDAARWYVSHPAPDRFEWGWLDRVVEAAAVSGLTLYLDLWHYGYPDWLDLMSSEAPRHFAAFAAEIAHRYPALEHYCVCNEPTALLEHGATFGRWRPFMKPHELPGLRRQIARMIIEASRAILQIRPEAQLILPEPWHAPDRLPLDEQAAVLDMVMGRREPELGGAPELVTAVGLNHYRDSTLPPLHRLFLDAHSRWPDKPLWFTETSGPPQGWQQAEWFWWMLAETRLANIMGANFAVFTWAPALSMYDWEDDSRHLPIGIWAIAPDGTRAPNGHMLEAIALARAYGYIV